jgi:hypothetical protein
MKAATRGRLSHLPLDQIRCNQIHRV